MRDVPLGVALVAVGLYFVGLGVAPFVDPPEGFHAEIARQMMLARDWATPRANGVLYLDKPPLLYWLVSASFTVAGVTQFAARLAPALAVVACAAVTARLGVLLGGPRLGLLAGLMAITNLGMFVYGRAAKPETLFVLWVTLAWTGFALAYVGDRRRGLALFYAALGLAVLTKGLLSPLGPLLVVAAFFWLTRERPLGPWAPWWGVLLAGAIALPWYVVMEVRSPGVLWYMLVDNSVHRLTRQRVFPGEDVTLGTVEFLVVTLLAFLPWALALPWAIARALQRPWEDATARLWFLVGLWSAAVLVFFTLVPFKLPHGALPAFPLFALLVARAWDGAIEGEPGAPSPRALLVPVLGLFALVAGGFVAAWMGVPPLSVGVLSSLDTATRNLTERGQPAPPLPLDAWAATVRSGAAIFALATVAMAVAVWRRSAALGIGGALATMIAFLPTVAADGMTQFARVRSARPLAEALAQRARPGDLVVHEGAIENSASILLVVNGPLRVVNGLQSNLAFGATFPEARDIFWDSPQLEAAWSKPGRHFLISAVDPARSVVRALPRASVHVIAHAGGRWLYSNLAERARTVDD